jgi:hypothetical protein
MKKKHHPPLLKRRRLPLSTHSRAEPRPHPLVSTALRRQDRVKKRGARDRNRTRRGGVSRDHSPEVQGCGGGLEPRPGDSPRVLAGCPEDDHLRGSDQVRPRSPDEHPGDGLRGGDSRPMFVEGQQQPPEPGTPIHRRRDATAVVRSGVFRASGSTTLPPDHEEEGDPSSPGHPRHRLQPSGKRARPSCGPHTIESEAEVVGRASAQGLPDGSCWGSHPSSPGGQGWRRGPSLWHGENDSRYRGGRSPWSTDGLPRKRRQPLESGVRDFQIDPSFAGCVHVRPIVGEESWTEADPERPPSDDVSVGGSPSPPGGMEDPFRTPDTVSQASGDEGWERRRQASQEPIHEPPLGICVSRKGRGAAGRPLHHKPGSLLLCFGRQIGGVGESGTYVWTFGSRRSPPYRFVDGPLRRPFLQERSDFWNDSDGPQILRRTVVDGRVLLG